MAGQLASLPLSIQLNDNARPYAGALLYIYDAGTTTPAVFYEDFATTVVLSWPLVTDASGRIPMFWVADGSYRVRLTDNAGNEIFDIPSITAVGPSTGASGGGTSVSSSQLFQTGDTLWVPTTGTRSGWVRHNGLTIGSSSSGASERANADCQALFELVWNTYSDSIAPVTPSRGGSALADWNANKRIALLDMRATTGFGVSDMGNSDLGVLNPGVGTRTTAGAGGGNPTKTILQTHFPNVNFNLSATAADHSHAPGTLAVGTGINNGTSVTRNFSSTSRNDLQASAGQTAVQTVSATSSTLSLTSGTVGGNTATSGALAVTGTAASGGSGTDFDIMPFFILGTWYVKL